MAVWLCKPTTTARIKAQNYHGLLTIQRVVRF